VGNRSGSDYFSGYFSGGGFVSDIQFSQTVQAAEQWEAEDIYRATQDALPPHKRDGYAEGTAELADHLRDLKKGN